MTSAMKRAGRGRRSAPDSAQHHRDWLALVDVTGPFLSLPVLRATWSTLDPIEGPEREVLRQEHGEWRLDPAGGQRRWVEYVLRDLLGWRDELRIDGLDPLAVEVPEHDTTLTPSFVLVEPGTDDVKPDNTRLLGMLCEPGTQPTARPRESTWAATTVDRLAQLCRHHGVELGLATDGRWWAFVRAPRGKVTTTAVFDAIGWAEAAERDVVRAFRSILGRNRFFGVPVDEQLPKLLKDSEENQEEITEALGVQVRQAVELLVAAIGRADVRERQAGGAGLDQVDAHEVYRGAVSVMMRVVFLLFAEERGLLPADNEFYAQAYAAGSLGDELAQHAREGSEDELAHSSAAWHRLLALFHAVYHGVEHPRLRMHPHDGSLFDPENYPWMPPLSIDDQTVLHMLRAVQWVKVGRGKNAETRKLTFRQLDVEQIGYVYEGLLSYEGFRADGVVVGLIGKEGLEEEVPLAELEALPLASLAATLAEKYKSSGIGSETALKRKLVELDLVAREENRKKLLAVTDGDYPLAERLLPFFGLIRPDLRELPVVILPGALYITESKLRKNTGTHYTPRFLAEEVVEHALEPLLFHVGPLQTPEKVQWTHKSSDELLELKIADIAMGSAAFLVAAARYLGDALVDAWAREGRVAARKLDETRAIDVKEAPEVIEARRQIIEHCLYGVDINPMAVEMAKLSLWLVSMDVQRPFTFLDDRLVVGDSLLGITNLEQLEYLHVDPVKGKSIHHDLFDWTTGLREQSAGVARLREQIAGIALGDDPVDALGRKRALLEDAQLQMGRLRLVADLAIGAALAHAARGEDGLAAASVKSAALVKQVLSGEGEFAAREQGREWLAAELPAGAFNRDPLHWPLVFPEVFERGGFDAIVGNPPFLGGSRITGPLGTAYREYMIECIAGGVRAGGRCDLVAYFVLRAHDLLTPSGQTGIIATNTLAQGDTREVCLAQLLSRGVSVRAAVKSEPWPSRSAALEYCAIWTSWAAVPGSVTRRLNGNPVAGITAALDPVARIAGDPYRLNANRGISHIGSYVYGTGFLVETPRAESLLARDAHYADVLRPYLIGQDLNSRSDCSASRWVIDFQDWPEERAKKYVECYRQVREVVKPEREALKRKVYRERWWQFAENQMAMRRAVGEFERVVAITQTSKTLAPAFVSTDQVLSHMLVLFASDSPALLAVLSSAQHYWWTVKYSATMKADLRYIPSDVFETLPMPTLNKEMVDLGNRLDVFRRDVMLSRRSGLTKTYNLVFDPAVTAEDIVELRHIHKAIDEATVRAYGWGDLLDQLDHGFHPAGRDVRYTIGPVAQREILDRLLELNHQRYAEEVAKGLHDKKGRKPKAAQDEGALFDV